MANTFIRVHPYSAADADAVIGEMCREEAYSTHVARPQAPDPELAARLREQIAAYMATPERYIDHEGRQIERKRRPDARCLVAGVASHPVPLGKVTKAEAESWIADMKAQVKREWPGQPIEFKVHIDEGYLHVHFALVGDANRLHPGLRAERDENGKRKTGKRSNDYRKGVTAFVDRYHDAVARPRGWARKSDKPTPWRIKDRALRDKAVELEKQLKELEKQVKAKPELQPQLDKLSAAYGSIWSSAKKQHWPRPETNAGFRPKPKTM